MTNKKLLINKIVWSVFALALWIVGLVLFLTALNQPKDGNALLMYVVWGALCSICVIKTVMSGAMSQGRSGRRKGANDYTVTDNGSHYTVQNHPIRGAIIGFIGGLIGGVIAGPIIIPINLIKNVVAIIKLAKNLRSK